MKKFIIALILDLVSIMSFGQTFIVHEDNTISVWDKNDYKDKIYSDIGESQIGSMNYICRTLGYLPGEFYSYNNFDKDMIFVFKSFTTELIVILIYDKTHEYSINEITNDFIKLNTSKFNYDKDFEDYIKFIKYNEVSGHIRESFIKSLNSPEVKRYSFTFENGYVTNVVKNETEYKILNKNVEIVKPVFYFQDEEGKDHILDDSKTFVHIKVDSFGEGINLVQYWIEQNGEKYNKHLVKDVLVVKAKINGQNGYMIMDNDFRYMFITESKELSWVASFLTKEAN